MHQNGRQGTGAERHIVLDLDFFSIFDGEKPFEDVSAWMDKAHDRVEEAFITSISKDKYQELKGEP